jgi:hypothetical protein
MYIYMISGQQLQNKAHENNDVSPERGSGR